MQRVIASRIIVIVLLLIGVVPAAYTQAAGITGQVVVSTFASSVSYPQGITAGPDRALWFTTGCNSIGRAAIHRRSA